MELQIRSSSMHYTAEYGKASHQNYKALLLPESTSPIENNDNNDNT
jgi:(p)ppGpp synthase/HD superfamily hydrolase